MNASQNVRAIRTLNFPTVGGSTDISALLGLTNKVVFSDDKWDLSGHPRFADGAFDRSINFEKVDIHFTDVVKMFALANLHPGTVATALNVDEDLLRVKLDITKGDPRPATVVTKISNVRSALSQIGTGQIQPGGWDHITDELPGNERHRRQCIVVLQRLHRFAELANVDLFGSEPWAGQTTTKIIALTAEEATGLNAVQPTDECFDVLGFTEFFIEHCAESIIDLIEFHHDPANCRPDGAFRSALFKDRPRPDHRNANQKKVLRNNDAREELQRREEAAREAGWLGKEERATRRVVTDIGTALATACLYSTQFMLALHSQDIARLDVNCIPKPYADGGRTIRSWRGKNREVGHQVEFSLSPRVERAINTMKRLVEAWRLDQDEITDIGVSGRHRLFVNPQAKNGERRVFGWSDGTGKDSRLHWLRDASVRLHELGTTTRVLQVEQLSSTQMRITALVAFASRECGHALAAEFGMWDSHETMFGYVGNVTPRLISLRKENGGKTLDGIEDRLRAGRMALMLKAEVDAQTSDGIGLSGNGVSKLERIYNDPEYDGLWARVQDDSEGLKNHRPLTAAEVKNVGTIERPLYSLPHTYCHFDPSKALCEGRGLENPNTCQEGKCANSIMTPGQRATVEIRRRTAVKLIEEHNSAGHRLKVLPYITENFPDIAEEFEGVSDVELVDLGLEEADWLLKFIVTGDREEAEDDE